MAILPNRSKGSFLLQDLVSVQLFGFASCLDSKCSKDLAMYKQVKEADVPTSHSLPLLSQL